MWVRLPPSAQNCPLKMKEKELNLIEFLKEVNNNPSTGTIETLISGNHRFIDCKAYRNLNVGDRVKVFFKDEWQLGTVVNKYFKKERLAPYIMIKTDKKVEEDPGAYLNGFGIEAPVRNPFGVIFANEKAPGKKIYRTWYKCKFNRIEEKILKIRDKVWERNRPF